MSKQSTESKTPEKLFIIIGCILIAVLLIIAVAVNVAKKRTEARLLAESESASIEASVAASMAEAEAEKLDNAYTVCEIPEINELVRNYFDARLSADTSEIFRLFGRTDTTANAALEKKLKAQASWIQSFNDITVYVADGMNENERFCIVTYIIDFRRTDTMAPGIMYFFAKRNDSGEYIIEEALLKDKLSYADTLLDTAFARDLIEDTDARLKEALNSNSTLSLIYTSFQNGEIYKESDLDVNADQQVDLFMNPEDSVLVDADTLKIIEEEASEKAQLEASEGAEDVYETAADDSENAEAAENTEAADNTAAAADGA